MSPEILQGLAALLIIIGIEAILSFDNAAVLAVIVNKNLPEKDRKKALQYGMIGAYVFRGLSLFLVSWILNNPSVGIIFKLLGGLYLIKLAYDGLMPKQGSEEEDAPPSWSDKFIAKLGLGVFWSTVIIVEFVDLVFSLDNLVAVVSLSKSMWIICIGVFIGIALMRIAASVFSKLLNKYPTLESSAYVVILLLGIKLALGGAADYFDSWVGLRNILHAHSTDLYFSGIMLAIFFLPMLFKKKKFEVSPYNEEFIDDSDLIEEDLILDTHEEAIAN